MFLQRINKKIAIVFAFLILYQAIFPNLALALTGGPSQPEVESFKPIGATDMVDLFTGDFSYNIPLLDIDGYPINISYQSNPGMDEEASWVGLGWTLNPGVMNREVRGFPDDFKGDTTNRQFSIKPNTTIGVSGSPKAEIFGMFKLTPTNGHFYNTYQGFGTESAINISFQAGDKGKEFELGANFNHNSQSGLDVDLSFNKGKFNLSSGINSRTGLKDLTWNYSLRKNERFHLIGGAISFAQRTYLPIADLPYTNSSFTYNASFGGEAPGLFTSNNISGYISIQSLAYKMRRDRCFGYLYLGEGRDSSKVEPNALMDYNQEKARPYRKDIPHIPIPIGTYDLYTAAGQGVSGQFRAVRNDVGTFGGQKRKNTSGSVSVGNDIGYGKEFKGGLNLKVTTVNGKGHEWRSFNRARLRTPYTNSSRAYESVFFKNTGENVPTDNSFYNNVGADQTVKVGLQTLGPEIVALGRYDKEKNKQSQGNISMPVTLARTTREKRNQVFSYLTAKEAAATGLDKQIISHSPGVITYPTFSGSSINRTAATNAPYQDHHISEITVTKDDGSRYVYGIPAYNKSQQEVTFSVDKSQAILTPSDPNFGLVTYTPLNPNDPNNPPNPENSVKNNKGRDNYFDKQKLGPYAYAHLLTAVLSADYADRTGNGITEDDAGNAVKINYSRVRSNYPWRVPVQVNKARYIEGRKTDLGDDKGTYLYGEKELWYVHSIESRNMVAQFYTTSDYRYDAKGVSGENGGVSTSLLDQPRRLDSIRLYTKADLRHNGPNNAIPIKTVVFNYYPNDPLCVGVPNHSTANRGKLTLQKITFKYQKSGKGVLNPYEFTYSTVNPSYNMGKYDRWGNYQDNPSNYPNNLDFPYTIQDPTLLSPSAWNLAQIKLPSGANINVEYESDDYAYVQDKRAHKMCFIQGFARDSSGGPGNLSVPNRYLYLKMTSGHVIYDYVVVKTDQINISAFSDAQIKKQFIDSLKNIYFDASVHLKGTSTRERIKGYMELDKTRLPKKLNNGLSLAIPIKSVTANKKLTHPISLAALQTMRLELPDITYGPGILLNNYAKTDMIKAVRQLITRTRGLDLSNLFTGFEKTAMNKPWAQVADVGETTSDRSWVRLPDPDYIKYGGGSRVKKVTINDQWNIAQGGGASTYGQEYSYRMTESGISTPISSGVAAYEPTLGGEENSLREPLPYKEKVKLAPSNFYYTETPLGESLYPSPVVGYRQVTVKNLTNPNVTRTATGSSVVKFYTAKEFPVLTDFTNTQPFNIKMGALSRFFRLNSVDFVTISQGFTVEINDMHGKMREEAVYNESGGFIRSTRYEYKVDDPNAERLHLNNSVSVANPNGSISTSTMGLDFDIWQDMQEESNETAGVGVEFNVDASFPFIVPIGIPALQREHTRLRTAATTKFIKRFGILDKVIVNENGSTGTTRNVLFDSETGNVLLTETQNEFNDNVYAFNYPAHWAYPSMGQAYKNISAFVTGAKIDNGVLSSVTNSAEIFSEGDEIIIQKENSTVPEPGRYFILYCQESIEVVNTLGVHADFNTDPLTIKVVRSGRRNQASASIGSVESLVNPALSSPITFNGSSKVTGASAATFQDQWSMFCESHPVNIGFYNSVNPINPFANGRKGNWRLNKSKVFFTDRNQTVATSSINRTSGTVAGFTPFWSYNSMSQLWTSLPDGLPWATTKEITMFDFRGNPLESKSPNGIYSSSQLGYNHTKVTAYADNARYQEMAYEGFEDYNFQNTNSSYGPMLKPDQGALKKLLFGFNTSTSLYQNITLDSLAAHTGKYSIKILAGGSSTARIIQKASSCDGPNPPADCPYRKFSCLNCVPQTEFGATTNTKFLISAWVATGSTLLNGGVIPVNTIGIEVVIGGIPQTLYPSGPVIDGWQRVEKEITVPSGQNVFINLKNPSATTAYFDDFRFHPNQANMKSYVYDNYTMRLVAELDENNYAMFYEYDDEGRLIRVKKETEKGVMSVKEARSNVKPNQP